MSRRALTDISWFVDREAQSRGEPGIHHSYIASLATTVNYLKGDVDPTWLMGASGFAFRLFVNEILCPSAMSVFEWAPILPEAVEQAGYHCTYVSRMWDESEKEQERWKQAHAAIVESIAGGVPAIVWDVADCEWGLIIGHNDQAQSYAALDHHGKPATLKFDQLGQRAVKILSVAIPGAPNGRDRRQIIHNALKAAVAHATQEEWTDRPEYENGLAGYDMWASALDKWAAILAAGKSEKIGLDVFSFATYYAEHHYSARCYAREFLRSTASGDEALHEALRFYEEVAAHMKPVWDRFSQPQEPTPEGLASLADSIRTAKTAEMSGINAIRRYLSTSSQ